MKNIDIVLENTCMKHVNGNSRLPEAVEKAIRENAIEPLTEAFSKSILLEAGESKVMHKLDEIWKAIKKFYFTMLDKIKGLIMDYKSNMAKDIEFIAKNKDKISAGISKLSSDERKLKVIKISDIEPTAVGGSIVEDLFDNYETEDSMKGLVEHNSRLIWGRTFNVKIGNVSKETNEQIVTRSIYEQKIFDENVIETYIKSSAKVTNEMVGPIKTVMEIITNSEREAKKILGLEEEKYNSEHLDRVIKYYKIIMTDCVKCNKLALDMVISSKNTVMALAKKCI